MPDLRNTQAPAAPCATCERCGAPLLNTTKLLDDVASFAAPADCTGACRCASWVGCAGCSNAARSGSIEFFGDLRPETERRLRFVSPGLFPSSPDAPPAA